MNDIVKRGIKNDEIKKIMVKTFKANNPDEFIDKVNPADFKSVLIADDLGKEDALNVSLSSSSNEEFLALRKHFRTDFDVNDP